MFRRFFSFDNVHTIVLLTALLSLPMLFQFIPEDDCASRYAPMAEAFADGNLDLALHSRFLPLYAILTGTACLVLNCSGYFACKLVCWILFSLSVYPVYHITKMVIGKEKIAVIAAYLMIFCYPLMSFIGYGVRDGLKSFSIVVLAWASIGAWKCGKFRYLLGCSVAAAALTLTRGDGTLFAIIVLAAIIVKEIVSGERKRVCQALLTGLLYLALLSPWLYFQYRNIGYPVPETRHAMILNSLKKHLPIIALLHNENSRYNLNPVCSSSVTATVTATVQQQRSQEIRTAQMFSILDSDYHQKKNPVSTFFKGLLKGIYPFYAVAALIAIIWRVRRKSWTRLETVLISLFLLHTLAIIAQIMIAEHKLYISSRYLLSAVPLYFPWSAAAFAGVYDEFKGQWRGRMRYLLLSAGAIAAVISYQQGIKQIISENFMAKRHEVEDLKTMIKLINAQNQPRINGVPTPFECHFYASPNIIADQVSLEYYAQCNSILPAGAKQHPGMVDALLKTGKIQFIALRKKNIKYYPHLKTYVPKVLLYQGKEYVLWTIPPPTGR